MLLEKIEALEAENDSLRQQLVQRVPDERAAFGRWADERVMNTRTKNTGEYAIHEVAAAWEAWQARATLPTAPAQPEQPVAQVSKDSPSGEPVAWACWADSEDPEKDKPTISNIEPLAYPMRKPLVYATQASKPMTDEQQIQKMREFGEYISSDKGRSIAFLKQVGILGPDGKTAPEFGGEDQGVSHADK